MKAPHFRSFAQRRPRCSRLAMAGLVSVLMLSAITASAQQAPDRPAPTSETHAGLQDALKRFPEADADKDGILTLQEAKAYREQLDERRRRLRARQEEAQRNRPQPDFADVRYGEHQRNVFDLWLPPATSRNKPLPVFMYFHGGGFVAGDKSTLDPRPYLSMGYAVVSSNYRFVNGNDIITPVPMQDCARALQFLRHKADQFGIDPDRVALSGGSAGAVITMWIAYNDDLADPQGDDPVARQSTRVSCIVPMAGPTNLDPQWIRRHVGGGAAVHSSLPVFYGVKDGDYSGPAVQALIKQSSAVHLATADDPPSMLVYSGRLDNVPLPEDASQGLVIHHPYFGKVLKDKLDRLGIPCDFRYGDNRPQPAGTAAFLSKYLNPN